MSQRSFLIIGSGGREHALAWKLSQAADRPTVYVAPGSDAISQDDEIRGGSVGIAADEFTGLADFARRSDITVTIVGPEAPLCAGIVDFFEERGLPIFGPRRTAARLEGSKSFAKEIMKAADIPTAAFEVFENLEDAKDYVRGAGHPLVLKADGLAGGKGVVISSSSKESIATLESFMADERFGSASRRVVIEEFLEGVELSFMVITDGQHVVRLATSQDHKRLGEGDTGPNTGGMGAFTPSAHTSPELEEQIVAEVIRPTLSELARRGIVYRGFLYAGLMLTRSGPKVLEFNVRMGDPETQALMMALDEELGAVLERAMNGELQDGSIASGNHAFCVVLASGGYPGPADKGHVISGIGEANCVAQTRVFHAGTKLDEQGRFINAAGRVLGVTSRAKTAAQARERAYAAVAKITWNGMQYRGDIGAD